MTIRVCPPCARFTAFKICKACGKETEEWKHEADKTNRVVGQVSGQAASHSNKLQPAQEDAEVEAAPGQEKEKGPRKAKADQGTEG